MANFMTYSMLLCLVIAVVVALPSKRGMCLSLCGPYGVKCPTGYECRGNGCGHECYRPKDYVAPLGCGLLDCDAHCPLGFVTGANGCDTCKCDYSALQHHDSTLGR